MTDRLPAFPATATDAARGEAQSSRFHWHGGALTQATARFGDPGPEGWLDLSTGIAPVAYPVGRIASKAWTTLPDDGAVIAFERVVRSVHGVPSQAKVLPVPGEQAALQWLPYCLENREDGVVVVPDPGYGGHGEAWTLADHPVRRRADPLEEVGRARVIVVINPNNPDGRRWAPRTLLEAARAQAASGGLLVVDEAFGEVTPDLTLLSEAGSPGLLILRSLGKFFGLPGPRFGWVAGQEELVTRLSQRLGPWAVSGPALDIGTRAEGDPSWRAAQRRRLRRRAARLERILVEAGFSVLGGTDLFLLARPPLVSGVASAARSWEGLARLGILTRPFTDHPDWLRFGLPPDTSAETRLRQALRALGGPVSSL